MQLTQEETFVALETSGLCVRTLRQMTALRGERFLPPLTRQPGTKRMRNVWSEEDLKQIVAAYDCWEESDAAMGSRVGCLAGSTIVVAL